ncbi:hypothetical protein JW824_05760 [bacterium]|nr:hypothetical protein [bacterium]RQV95971.1 MAG: hypothetical protein EH221_05325 [bacterium]
MIKDERIISTRNKYLAHGFYIFYFSSLLAFLYRLFILKQTINEFLDLFIIFHLGVFYVYFNLISHGAWYSGHMKKRFIRMALAIFVGNIAAVYLRENLISLSDVFATILGMISGLLIIVPIMLYLNYRWKKRNELE